MPDFIDHVDLMSVSPGAPTMPSLKLLGGRLHSQRIQELPFDISRWIDDDDRKVMGGYLGNDLDTTIDLATDLMAQIDLRTEMSKQYGVDLRSKSDAQIAEAVIKSQIERNRGGRKLYPPDIRPGSFKYEVPEFIRFKTPRMQQLLRDIRELKFAVDSSGTVKMPEYFSSLDLTIGNSKYTMGIGGLHSNEANISHYSDDNFVLLDRDVTSFYPSIILRCRLFPKHIGESFLTIYESIFKRRLAAKAAGEKTTAETLKIVLNGSFGKLGSPYSALYSPNLLIQVTLTGQLTILMLIEAMEMRGMSVVSANTDGFVTKVPRARRAEFEEAIAAWEKATGFGTEETEYLSLHSQSVNTYLAFKQGKNGKIEVKRKGDFAECGPGIPGASGQKKNPSVEVCTEAVIAYLRDGTPVEDTIEWCFDPRKFVAVRRVKGGAEKDGERLGKVLRWYYAKGVSGGFAYESNGNAVPQTIGAKLMMELPRFVPRDVDYSWYEREAYAILDDLGVGFQEPDNRTGFTIARLPDAKNIHTIDLATKKALCGQAQKKRREPWVEYKQMPDGHRYCTKCKKANEL
jgi:hypothetical protein